MEKRIIVRLISGLSFAGHMEKESTLMKEGEEKYICIRPREKVELKLLIPVREIETAFIDGNKIEGEALLTL